MIILGSSSPRRIELIKTITNDFKIVKPTFDEKLVDVHEKHLALIESQNKAFSIKNLVNPDDCIISCDTIVRYKDKVFGKPINYDDAFNTLSLLSNKTHEVISGYTILYKDQVISKEVITKVTFNYLSPELINNYINSINVYDKAGSYAIQDDEKFHLIKNIKGSLNNVIGFPIEEIKEDLIKLKAITI